MEEIGIICKQNENENGCTDNLKGKFEIYYQVHDFDFNATESIDEQDILTTSSKTYLVCLWLGSQRSSLRRVQRWE